MQQDSSKIINWFDGLSYIHLGGVLHAMHSLYMAGFLCRIKRKLNQQKLIARIQLDYRQLNWTFSSSVLHSLLVFFALVPLISVNHLCDFFFALSVLPLLHIIFAVLSTFSIVPTEMRLTTKGDFVPYSLHQLYEINQTPHSRCVGSTAEFTNNAYRWEYLSVFFCCIVQRT